MPIFKGSRYENSDVISINDGGIVKLDVDKGKEFTTDDLEEDEYTIYKVVAGDTLESIAYDQTGDSSNYYILAQINNILDPFENLEGKNLIIPSEEFFLNI